MQRISADKSLIEVEFFSQLWNDWLNIYRKSRNVTDDDDDDDDCVINFNAKQNKNNNDLSKIKWNIRQNLDRIFFGRHVIKCFWKLSFQWLWLDSSVDWAPDQLVIQKRSLLSAIVDHNMTIKVNKALANLDLPGDSLNEYRSSLLSLKNNSIS